LNPPTPINGPKKITTAAVVKYAERLRDEADREEAVDPYASGYRPTEAAARKDSARFGPEEAINRMRRRAAMHKRDARMAATIAANSLDKHRNRQRNHREQRNKQREHLSAGTRIDGAIARMSLIASPGGAQIGQSVHGGTPDHSPTFCVDAADKARRIAIKAVREIEDLEDEARVRDVSKAA
jgi:hypothetical protein